MPVLQDYLGIISTAVANPDIGDQIRRSVAGGWETYNTRVSALPTPDGTQQGKVLTLLGGAGVADQAYICLKAAGGSYSWKLLVSG